MKVTITTMKAPWPTGAAIGDVVALPGDTLPAWAVGKCMPAEDGAKAQHRYEPPEVHGSQAAAVTPPAIAELEASLQAGGKALQDALDEIERLKAAHNVAVQDLQVKLEDAGIGFDSVVRENEGLRATHASIVDENGRLSARIAELQTDDGKSAAALKAADDQAAAEKTAAADKVAGKASKKA